MNSNMRQNRKQIKINTKKTRICSALPRPPKGRNPDYANHSLAKDIYAVREDTKKFV